jgi:outer membrane protein assembly factor BamB
VSEYLLQLSFLSSSKLPLLADCFLFSRLIIFSVSVYVGNRRHFLKIHPDKWEAAKIKEREFEMTNNQPLNKVRFKGTKSVATMTLILLLSFSSLAVALPIATAHTPEWNIPTYAYLNVAPDPVGVGQTLLLTFWLDKVPPTSNTIYGDRWQDFTIDVTKPDGSTQTLGPFTSDNVGAAWAEFMPETVGVYSFQFSFPGQILSNENPAPGPVNEYVGDYYQPSISHIVEVTVQQDPIEPWPATPFPNDYWTRPINNMNPEWKAISGDWLMTSRDVPDSSVNSYNPYSTAPDSAHIMWTYPVAIGGVVGGDYTDTNYYTGMSYENKFTNPVIMYGRLYFNMPLSTSAGIGGTVCIDLRTGETLWHQKDISISFGQEFDYMSPNQFGAIPYLWSTGRTYNVYDPDTGDWLFSFENATTGSTLYGPNGELLVYILDGRNNWLALWNSTKAVMEYATNPWTWRPLTVRTMDWGKGIQWNVTTNSYSSPATQSIAAVTDDIVLATTGSMMAGYSSQMEIGYDARTGEELWVQNRSTPVGATSWALMGSAGDGVYTEFYQSSTEWQGFDLYSGEQLWGPTESYPRAFGMYSWRSSNADGILYAIDYGGYLHAYNIQTGELEWDFFAGSSGIETPYGAWPLNHPSPVIADGKVYVSSGHGYNPPLFKGAKMYCVNATNGELIWSLLGFHSYNPMLIADGYLVAYNSYDGQIYCYGKGPTATTVTAPNVGVPLGSSIILSGTVTDVAAGTNQDALAARYPNGVPAISDEDMSAWMEYLYMQQPKPNDLTGVSVHLTALDSNGNTQEIGTAVSDYLGNYAFDWTPPIPGMYTVTASFEGSASYYPSEAGASFVVSEAAAPAVTPTQPPTQTAAPTPAQTPAQTVAPSPSEAPQPATTAASPTMTYIAIGAAVVVIVVTAAALVLRKRK